MFFIAEKPVAPLLGKSPALAPADLVRGDLRFSLDFRDIYAGVLEGWLRTPAERVLGRKFNPVRLAA
jgi:uncharacterized protein (DUF1501 family)